LTNNVSKVGIAVFCCDDYFVFSIVYLNTLILRIYGTRGRFSDRLQ